VLGPKRAPLPRLTQKPAKKFFRKNKLAQQKQGNPVLKEVERESKNGEQEESHMLHLNAPYPPHTHAHPMGAKVFQRENCIWICSSEGDERLNI